MRSEWWLLVQYIASKFLSQEIIIIYIKTVFPLNGYAILGIITLSSSYLCLLPLSIKAECCVTLNGNNDVMSFLPTIMIIKGTHQDQGGGN